MIGEKKSNLLETQVLLEPPMAWHGKQLQKPAKQAGFTGCI